MALACDIVPTITNTEGKKTKSIAFKSIVNKISDRQKSKEVYTNLHDNKFLDWFGDWVSASEDTIKGLYPNIQAAKNAYNLKDIDKNGEPVITDEVIDVAKNIKNVKFNTATPKNDATSKENKLIQNSAQFIAQEKLDIEILLNKFGNSELSTTLILKDKKISLDLEKLIKEYTLLDIKESIVNITYTNSQLIKILNEIISKYENVKFQDFFNSELANEKFEQQRKEVSDFLLQAVTIVNSLYKVRNIEYLPDSETTELHTEAVKINDSLRVLSEMEGTISNLQLRLKRLYFKHIESHIATLSTNPEVEENLKKIYEEQYDENGPQRYLDALLDTNNPLVANIVKKFEQEMATAKFEESKILKEVYAILDDYTDYDFLFEKYTTGSNIGENTGKFNNKYLWSDYVLAKKAYFEKLQEDLDNNKITYKKYKKLKKEFFDKNLTDHPTERNQNGEPTKILVDKWLNKSYALLSEKQKEDIDKLKNIVVELGSTYGDSITKLGYFPAVRKTNDSFTKKLANTLGFREGAEPGTPTMYDTEDNQIRFIPFRFISFINHRPTYDIPSKTDTENLQEYHERALNEVNLQYNKDFKSFSDIKKANEMIIAKNKKLAGSHHGANISYNVREVLPLFVTEALKYKHKKNIESEILLLRANFENLKILKTDGLGRKIIDGTKARLLNTRKEKSVNAKDSNIYKHLNDWIEMVFYEEFKLDEGKRTQFSDFLQNYSSLKGLGFNPFSAINNLVYGEIMTQIEAISGYHISVNSYMKAAQFYNKGLASYFADTYKDTEKSSSLQNALIKFFDTTQSQTEIAEGTDKERDSKIYRWLLKNNAAFVMQESGEHLMQNKTLFGMMYEYRLDNEGKIINYNQFIEKKLQKVNTKDINEMKKINESNDKIKKENKKAFEELPKLIDVFELDSGFATIKKEYKIAPKELENFKIKVRGVNQKIHGIYNKNDKGAIEKYALGRLALQFRHWARPGWNKRFGSKFGKSYWNERRGEWDKGAYVSFFDFLTIPFKENNKENWSEDEERTTFMAAKAILRDYGKYIANARVYWNTLSEFEKSNVKRTASELIYLIAVMTALNLLKAGMDDDDKESKLLNVTLYQLDRLKSELNTYNPSWGWFNESKKLLRSPAAASTVLEDILKLSQGVLMYPLQDDEKNYYQSGVYNKRLKIDIWATKLIPGATQAQRYEYIQHLNEFYKLY